MFCNSYYRVFYSHLLTLKITIVAYLDKLSQDVINTFHWFLVNILFDYKAPIPCLKSYKISPDNSMNAAIIAFSQTLEKYLNSHLSGGELFLFTAVHRDISAGDKYLF